jgi:hypothetical protein
MARKYRRGNCNFIRHGDEDLLDDNVEDNENLADINHPANEINEPPAPAARLCQQQIVNLMNN